MWPWPITGTNAMPNLTDNGDSVEKSTWPLMKSYVSKYETLWQMHVEPLRNPGSIALRQGIDPDFEFFAMNHYSAYINLVRSREKIEIKSDDLGFAEEIWAQLQRVVELAIKQADAFDRIYLDATKNKPGVDTTNLHKLQSSIGEYRNILHDPIQASIKNADGIRLIPRRDTLQKYKRWTDVMYHRTEEDFVPVDAELRSDFERVCAILQGFWSDIERASRKILENKRYVTKRSSGNAVAVYGSGLYNLSSTTSNVAIIGTQGPWWNRS
jgi:hypothetical protein